MPIGETVGFISGHIEAQVYRTKNYRVDFEEEYRPEEYNEVLVVSLSHARPNPRTMVVQPLNTAAAGAAVDGPGRPVDIAGGAVFHFGEAAVQNIQIFRPHFIGHHIGLFLVSFVQEFLKLLIFRVNLEVEMISKEYFTYSAGNGGRVFCGGDPEEYAGD